MLPQERLPYSAMEGRPPLKLPDGLRLILWPLMSLEQWDISRPMARMVITPPQGCFRFLPDRAKLDIAGWASEDIFAHS